MQAEFQVCVGDALCSLSPTRYNVEDIKRRRFQEVAGSVQIYESSVIALANKEESVEHDASLILNHSNAQKLLFVEYDNSINRYAWKAGFRPIVMAFDVEGEKGVVTGYIVERKPDMIARIESQLNIDLRIRTLEELSQSSSDLSDVCGIELLLREKTIFEDFLQQHSEYQRANSPGAKYSLGSLSRTIQRVLGREYNGVITLDSLSDEDIQLFYERTAKQSAIVLMSDVLAHWSSYTIFCDAEREFTEGISVKTPDNILRNEVAKSVALYYDALRQMPDLSQARGFRSILEMIVESYLGIRKQQAQDIVATNSEPRKYDIKAFKALVFQETLKIIDALENITLQFLKSAKIK